MRNGDDDLFWVAKEALEIERWDEAGAALEVLVSDYYAVATDYLPPPNWYDGMPPVVAGLVHLWNGAVDRRGLLT